MIEDVRQKALRIADLLPARLRDNPGWAYPA